MYNELLIIQKWTNFTCIINVKDLRINGWSTWLALAWLPSQFFVHTTCTSLSCLVHGLMASDGQLLCECDTERELLF